MNHSFQILHQFTTQVTKSQVKSWLILLDTIQSTANTTKSKQSKINIPQYLQLFTTDKSIFKQVLCMDTICVRCFIKSCLIHCHDEQKHILESNHIPQIFSMGTCIINHSQRQTGWPLLLCRPKQKPALAQLLQRKSGEGIWNKWSCYNPTTNWLFTRMASCNSSSTQPTTVWISPFQMLANFWRSLPRQLCFFTAREEFTLTYCSHKWSLHWIIMQGHC